MTGRRELNVLAPGILSLIEDAGRLGWLSAGVGVSGAADPGSYELANRLVANPPGAAAIEVTMGGLRAEVGCRTVVAVTGAPAQLTVDGRAFGHDSVVPVEPGQVIELGMPPVGVRSYLAIRGGIDVEPVLGSRSTDTMSGLGPPALAAGDVLPIGAEPAEWPIVDVAPVPPLEAGTVVVRAMAGPRAEWFAAPHVIFETEWIASPPPTASACASTRPTRRRDRPARSTASCRSRGCRSARSRCPRAASRSPSSPTTPSRAATRSSRPSTAPTSDGSRSCAPASACASHSTAGRAPRRSTFWWI
ncbi:hypothetical protein GCM10025881_33510 [Pseudolysinimonas kribbensis]|uniref:Carboxyltransferase domain-containing protein n=1 Tax=Pseudolysinimonas kribbensis TaxID=433641 RepID=A0ABQ6KDA4_9MICO|nr:hypothetical protein GCM10025881_33510 [Pseudolysinimonas kribbensis]